jgi:hypothetical protein
MSDVAQAQSLVDAALRTFNSPPAVETQTIVRERRFIAFDLITLVAELTAARATGTLLVDFGQGGISSARFREERKIEPR